MRDPRPESPPGPTVAAVSRDVGVQPSPHSEAGIATVTRQSANLQPCTNAIGEHATGQSYRAANFINAAISFAHGVPPVPSVGRLPSITGADFGMLAGP